MAKDDMHKDVDRWSRGRTNANRDGAGSYTESDKEALARLKRGGDLASDNAKGDRSEEPGKKPYGSLHYPHKN